MSCKHGEWHPCDICDEVDAAFKSGYEEGGKLSIDLTMKHLQRAEKAEALAEQFRKLLNDARPYICGCTEKCTDFECTTTAIIAAIDSARAE